MLHKFLHNMTQVMLTTSILFVTKYRAEAHSLSRDKLTKTEVRGEEEDKTKRVYQYLQLKAKVKITDLFGVLTNCFRCVKYFW